MTPLLISVFVASLLGSVHCAGMCGPLAACAGACNTKRSGPRVKAIAAYQLGRLSTYLVIGAIAGALGSGLNLGGQVLGLQRTAVWVAGSMLILVGVVELVRRLGGWTPQFQIPPRLLQSIAKLNRAATKLPPIWRALTIGLLTGLMPCGWLYAFALSAAATAHPLSGMAVMGVFWAGAVPMLVAISWGSSAILSRVLQRFPYATALVLIAAGLMTITYRQGFASAADLRANFAQPAITQDEANSDGDPYNGLIDQIDSLDHEQMPCCAAREASE